MNIRQATIEDINTLVQLRIDYLITDKGSLSQEEITAISAQLKTYFEKHIGQDFIAMLAEIDYKIVSSVFLVITEKPSSPIFITGKTGTLLNVFTYPEYRRKGIATKLLSLVIEEAKQQGVSLIDLSATPDGKPLYEKLGFTQPKSKYTSMRLQLI